jgi:L-histidine N-alpha-methyltransferase
MTKTISAPFGLWDRGVTTNCVRADVLRGLSAAAKAIPSKYFYDEAGSKLFDRICELSEYYLTRTELTIMKQHVQEMADLAGPACLLVEYGSGSSVKSRLLLDWLETPAAYMPVDISREHLQSSASALGRDYPHLEVLPICADFTQPLDLPVPALRSRRLLVYFPGSTIGNLTPPEAIRLLRRTAHLGGPGSGLLLGVDLKKDPQILHAAYNDQRGVTAAFNLNLLERINRELGADFQTAQFWHHANYNPREGRIEMYLISQKEQQVRIGPQTVTLAEGEAIRTEYSYKYSSADIRHLAAAGGYEVRSVWTDAQNHFCVAYLIVAGQ